MKQLCDEAGIVVGYFLTVKEHERVLMLENDRKMLYSLADGMFTEEELDAAEAADDEEYTTEEVLAYLQTL